MRRGTGQRRIDDLKTLLLTSTMKELSFDETLALAKEESEQGPIFVGGPSGGGKSWLCAQIGGILNIPVINLDKYSKHVGDNYPASGYPVKHQAVYNGWPTNLKEVQESLGFKLILTPKPTFEQFLEVHKAKVKSLDGLKDKTKSREWHLKTSKSTRAQYHELFTSYVKLVNKLLPGVRHEIMSNPFSGEVVKGWFEH